MRTSSRRLAQAGFTLIEILVALILLAVLAAAVFPVVSQQVGQGDAPRAANDLTSIRSGIEQFNVNVRRRYPADLEDLVNHITQTDQSLAATVYNPADTMRWDGPYIDATILGNANPQSTDTAFVSGFDAQVQNDLYRFNAAAANGGAVTAFASPSGAENYVAVRLDEMTLEDFRKLNSLIDGEADTSNGTAGRQTGKLRCPGTDCAAVTSGDLDDPVYYLATPYRD